MGADWLSPAASQGMSLKDRTRAPAGGSASRWARSRAIC